jgi:small subunit ribosomal protein S8e
VVRELFIKRKEIMNTVNNQQTQKLGERRVRAVRTRGGNEKFRALRLDSANFSWQTEAVSRKSRIISVVYNTTNNELVRTNTLVKGSIIQIDATPFRQWYFTRYGVEIGHEGEPRFVDPPPRGPKPVPKPKKEKSEKKREAYS